MGCSLLYQYLSWSEAGAHTGQPCTCSGQHLIHWQALRDLCAEKNLVPTPAVFIVYASWLLCTFPFPHLKHRKPSATCAPSPACDCCLSLYSGGSVAFTAHSRAGASQAPGNLSSGHWLRRQECNIMGIHLLSWFQVFPSFYLIMKVENLLAFLFFLNRRQIRSITQIIHQARDFWNVS